MIAAEITTWFIILTTGTVLYPAGVTVNSAADAAQALVPLAGQYASALFAAGLAGASFLAACVLPGITASAVCEAFGWERGVDRSWNEAPAYRVMMLAQVINGVLLPVLMVCMVLIASDKRVMGQYANGRVWTALTWFTIVVVIVLTIIMFVLQAMGL